jgi:acyl-CoA thioester hydrolase
MTEDSLSSPLPRRADFAHALPIQTRWNDNDVYGHVNNVVFYSYFDTVINRWLVTEGGLSPATSDVIGLCVESQCRYIAPASYPEDLVASLRVSKVGRSSVRYEIGIFREDLLLAIGSFVHVFVDRAGRRPTPIPDQLRAALERLVAEVG